MDTARRWQVGSVATAVASLGLGAALLARPVFEVVPSIDLDQVNAIAAFRPQRPAADANGADGPAIVVPRNITGTSQASALSPVSTDEVGDVTTEVTPAPPAPSPPAAPAAPAEPSSQSTSSPDSDASAPSVDSVSSVDSSD